MYYLPTCMDTGICPAGTNDGYGMIGNNTQRVFDTLLYRWRMALPLPSEKIGAIVFNSQCITHDFKLDLARAYLSLGDIEASRSMLDDVLKSGNEEQRAEAKQMLDEI